jgi:predicted Zn-dependent protease
MEQPNPRKRPYAGSLSFLAMSLIACGLGGCAVNPATGERNFSIIPESQEIAMGKEAAEQVAQSIGLYDDPKAQQYVADLGKRLAASSERPELPWRFQVVDDPAVNAFALPGGPIFVTRGLMTHMGSEAQLAAVMGHEIGHVTAKHSVRQMSKATLAQLGLMAGMVFSDTVRNVGQLGMAGLQLLMLKYGRDAEREADDLGFRYSLANKYDVRSMPDVFATLKRVGEASGASRLPDWMATHPSPDERIERINKMIAEKNPPAGQVDRDQYLAITDGMVFGTNPRQGFFEGNTFKHPEMRFQIAVPSGWKAQNLAQAVVAESPQGNAGYQLAVGKEEPPAQALEKFATQEGIIGIERFDARVAGAPAAAARFAAKTQGGEVRGLVTFFTHQGKTFQVLGLAAPEAFAAAEGVLRQVAESFAPLTDPAALAARPARLKVVVVDRAMTLAELAGRYPGLPVERLAIINQLEPGSRLQPGQKMKVVEGQVREQSAVAAK